MKRICLALLVLALSTLLPAQSRRGHEGPGARPQPNGERSSPESRGRPHREAARQQPPSVVELRAGLRQRLLRLREQEVRLRELLQRRGQREHGGEGRPTPRWHHEGRGMAGPRGRMEMERGDRRGLRAGQPLPQGRRSGPEGERQGRRSGGGGSRPPMRSPRGQQGAGRGRELEA